MQQITDTAQVIPFPTRPPETRRIDRSAADAVRVLAEARLIDEREAVSALRDIGCTEGEIDLVRAVYAARRWRI